MPSNNKDHVAFKDYFSGHSQDYDAYRPHYPDELFFHLSHVTEHHNCAWDCATGTGQAAVELAKYYNKVIATDASDNQVRQAAELKNVQYATATAEDSGIVEHSIDLITVAQALHWFDLDRFAKEVDRVLVDHGVLAVWTYNLLTIEQDIDEYINHLYSDLLGPYWAPERTLVENGYQDINFPFTELDVPQFDMYSHWNLRQLIGYLNTWSAVKQYESVKQHNPIELIFQELATAWGDGEQERPVRWPLALRIWRKS